MTFILLFLSFLIIRFFKFPFYLLILLINHFFLSYFFFSLAVDSNLSTTDVNHRGERVVALMVKDDSLVGKKVHSTVKWSQPLSLDYCYDDSSIRHTSHAMPKG